MDMERSVLTRVPYAQVPDSITGLMHDKSLMVTKPDGSQELLDIRRLHDLLVWASSGHEATISLSLILQEVMNIIFNGITVHELDDALILGTTTFVERDPAYGYVAAQLLLKKLFAEVTGKSIIHPDTHTVYHRAFELSITRGIQAGILAPQLADFDLAYLAQAINPERDRLLDYMGLKTLYERYFTKAEPQRFELPQHFWMRVAMGLSLNEANKNERAREFYELISKLEYVPGTPTLLHSGLTRPQLSSCFLNTVDDDLTHIFKCLGDNAQLSKWSGGIGTDWTNIRATGAFIKTIKTESQGVIPFLKIANDVTAAINRSGKRRAAACVYLEAWHFDIEDFVDLRRNTGDERRRTHDINTAVWIPDLFMKRVQAETDWTLFSPDETPELHHIYGTEFEAKYQEYERKAQQGGMEKVIVIPAVKLWRKILSRLFETGHPWITFKDPCNIRSPQDHVGVIHNSNLCTEITLNTSADETAVCNLGSVNLAKHVVNGKVDEQLLKSTIKTAMRMLDNVIDINYYPTVEARNSNMRHRPVGLGVMGFQDALYKLDIAFDDPRALTFSDEIMERISYEAIMSSSELAKERGAYSSYEGSKWQRGLLPQDTIAVLEQERGMAINVDRNSALDWTPVRAHIVAFGMRNSNCMAIAPTATISNIAGCIPCIEPIYKNIYVKANMSGEFTVVNKYLIDDLKKLSLWSKDMLDQLKYHDGQLALIDKIPDALKIKYKEAFEIDPEWLLKLTAVRAKWIDQSQSHNVFMKGVSGAKLSAIYLAAWNAGLKTTYYLRTLGASQIEKATLDSKKFGFTQKREYTTVTETAEPTVKQDPAAEVDFASEQEIVGIKACSLSTDPSCEVCQ